MGNQDVPAGNGCRSTQALTGPGASATGCEPGWRFTLGRLGCDETQPVRDKNQKQNLETSTTPDKSLLNESLLQTEAQRAHGGHLRGSGNQFQSAQTDINQSSLIQSSRQAGLKASSFQQRLGSLLALSVSFLHRASVPPHTATEWQKRLIRNPRSGGG